MNMMPKSLLKGQIGAFDMRVQPAHAHSHYFVLRSLSTLMLRADIMNAETYFLHVRTQSEVPAAC